jgi:hypothetical protein
MGDIASGSKFGQTTLWIEMPDRLSVKLEGYEEHFWNASILLLLRSDDMDRECACRSIRRTQCAHCAGTEKATFG